MSYRHLIIVLTYTFTGIPTYTPGRTPPGTWGAGALGPLDMVLLDSGTTDPKCIQHETSNSHMSYRDLRAECLWGP